ncbi:hypothetical protein BVI434_1290023 [Burkholderia vietnamiensis]|nr:hypothetical protein BVI434_1290023 [Burkholderia vietnamiensis]CAG9230699.1 hypothetical protein BVI1335_750017 [Burkholderia vietnamiensis]
MRGRRVRQDLAKLSELLVFQLHASCETTNLCFGVPQADLQRLAVAGWYQACVCIA